MKQNQSIYFMVYSVIATSLMYAIIKYLKDFSVYQIIFFRAIVTLAFTTPLILISKIKILGNNKLILLFRGFLGLISMVFFFQSIKYLDLGISVSIRYSSPIFATIFAVLFLREKVNIIQWIFIIISFTGIILINVIGVEIDLIGFLYALLSAISLGLVFLITNKIGNTESPLVIINYFMFIALVFSGLMAIDKWVSPTLFELMLLILSGGLGYIGVLYLTKSFQNGKVNIVAPLKYLEVIFTIILGVCFFGEIHTEYSLLAIFLILIGVFFNILLKKNKYK
ncbi:DMT family transporter [Flavobacteriaceae bacterium]|nr:DMT family transporter [Flavobacteriaceae bacterium]